MLGKIVMVGTSPDALGGIASVVQVYKNLNLFERVNAQYITTHDDGGALKRLSIFFRALLLLTKVFMLEKVVLCHMHVSQRGSVWRKFLIMLLCNFFRIPVLFHLHGSQFAVFFDGLSAPKKKVVIWMLEKSKFVVALSEQWKSWLLEKCPNANVVVLLNSVIVPNVLRDNHLVDKVLFLGRLGKRKGVYDLVQAAKLLKSKNIKFTLLLGGDGEIFEVKKLIEELDLKDHVHVLGWISGDEKIKLLSESSIYCLPSYNEGLPMSILEAMSYGLPVISTPVGGIPEAITDGHEGYLVEPGDVAKLADRLEALLSNQPLRSTMGLAARNKCLDRFSAEKCINDLLVLYKNFY